MPKRSKQDVLAAFADLVEQWAPRLDLVAPGDVAYLETRHIADSLRLVPLLDLAPPGPCADVGSGGGFPGVPLAISDPGRRWSLIEPRVRRAAFLEEVVRRLDLNCEVLVARVEEVASAAGGTFAFVTARALAPPARAVELIRPLVAPGGIAALFLGERADIPPGAELWAEGVAIVRNGGTGGEG